MKRRVKGAIPLRNPLRDEKSCMDAFLADAESILETGLNALRSGQKPSALVILKKYDGSIEVLADCDWPLNSLRAERGARCAWRITSRQNSIVVEGEEGGRRCRLEETAEYGRRLLSAGHGPLRLSPTSSSGSRRLLASSQVCRAAVPWTLLPTAGSAPYGVPTHG